MALCLYYGSMPILWLYAYIMALCLYYGCMPISCSISCPYAFFLKFHPIWCTRVQSTGKLPNSVKAQTALKDLAGLLESDEKLLESLSKTVDIKSPCEVVRKSKVCCTVS